MDTQAARELAILRARVTELEAAVEGARREAEVERVRAISLEGAVRTGEARVQRLDQVLSVRRSDDGASLGEHLRARGVLGGTETEQLVRSLIETGRLSDLVKRLAPTSSVEFSAWLDESTVLLGPSDTCAMSGTRAVLRVPSERCEVCGGADIQRVCRKLVDACLMQGITRVAIVGGGAKHHRQLRERVHHHRLQLHLVPGTARRTRQQACEDILRSDIVVVWASSHLSPGTSELYTDQADQGRVIILSHRLMGSMLGAVTHALQADEL
jgi:hypothetical protein